MVSDSRSNSFINTVLHNEEWLNPQTRTRASRSAYDGLCAVRKDQGLIVCLRFLDDLVVHARNQGWSEEMLQYLYVIRAQQIVDTAHKAHVAGRKDGEVDSQMVQDTCSILRLSLQQPYLDRNMLNGRKLNLAKGLVVLARLRTATKGSDRSQSEERIDGDGDEGLEKTTAQYTGVGELLDEARQLRLDVANSTPSYRGERSSAIYAKLNANFGLQEIAYLNAQWGLKPWLDTWRDHAQNTTHILFHLAKLLLHERQGLRARFPEWSGQRPPNFTDRSVKYELFAASMTRLLNPEDQVRYSTMTFGALRRLAKSHFAFGRFRSASHLLHLALSYTDRGAEEWLDIQIDLVRVQEQINRRVAVERAESLLPFLEDAQKGEHSLRPALLKRFHGLVARLASLKKNLGQVAGSQAIGRRWGRLAPNKAQADSLEAHPMGGEPPSSQGAKIAEFQTAIQEIDYGLTQQKPRHLFAIVRVSNLLDAIEPGAATQLFDYADTCCRIRAFLDFWMPFCEANRLVAKEVKLKEGTDTVLLARHTILLHACYIHELFCPTDLPRFLFKLALLQETIAESGSHEWKANLDQAAKRASWVGDWQTTLKASVALLRVARHGQDAKRYKTMIAVAENVLYWTPFGLDKIRMLEKLLPYCQDACFGLAAISRSNLDAEVADWLFRGIEVVKSRRLVGLRADIPGELAEMPSPEETEMILGQRPPPSAWELLRLILVSEVELETGVQRAQAGSENTEQLLEKLEDLRLLVTLSMVRKHRHVRYMRGAKPVRVREIGSFLKERRERTALATYLSRELPEGKSQVLGSVVWSARQCEWVATWFNYELDEPIGDLVYSCQRAVVVKSDESRASLERAHDRLLGWLHDKRFRGIDSLLVIPDQSLAGLPFQALTGNYTWIHPQKTKEPVLRNFWYGVVYYPSAVLARHYLMRSSETKANVLRSVLAFGSYEEECEWHTHGQALQTILGATGSIFKGQRLLIADAESGMRALGVPGQGFSVVYALGHGDTTGSIEFERDSQSVPVTIRWGDWLKLGRKGSFVFLNSCWAGRGRPFGTDVLGFAFSILASANDSCLLPIREVPSDFARTFAEEIFQSLSAGRTVRESYHEAALDSLEKGRMEWALYQLSGSPGL